MQNIYIARHGQNLDNAKGILNGRRDLPLTDIGVDQANSLAIGIKETGLKIDVLLTSPLIRAVETASIIANLNNLKTPIIEQDLIERDFGAMTGVRQTMIEELCAPDIIKTNTITYFLSPEGSETFPVLIDRAGKLLSKISKKYKNKSILLVTHGDIGKMIYAKYYNLNWKAVLKQFHFGNSELLRLAPNSTHIQSQTIKIKQYNL